MQWYARMTVRLWNNHPVDRRAIDLADRPFVADFRRRRTHQALAEHFIGEPPTTVHQRISWFQSFECLHGAQVHPMRNRQAEDRQTLANSHFQPRRSWCEVSGDH